MPLTIHDSDVLGPQDMDETQETARLEAAGARVILCPWAYRRLDRAPVVLVHGFGGSPLDLAELADHIAASGDRWPWLCLYDDRHSYLDRSGAALAAWLPQFPAAGQRTVGLVAHSMGGIVARCALNFLQDPAWFQDPADHTFPGAALSPAASRFDRLDLVAIDTPWHGWPPTPVDIRVITPQETAIVDMVVNSALFAGLYDVALPPHIAIHEVEANNAAAGLAQDSFHGFSELSNAQLDALIAWCKGQVHAFFARPRLRSQWEALLDAAEARDIEPRLRQEAAAGTLTRQRIKALLAEAVPPVPGSHMSILATPRVFAAVDAYLS